MIAQATDRMRRANQMMNPMTPIATIDSTQVNPLASEKAAPELVTKCSWRSSPSSGTSVTDLEVRDDEELGELVEAVHAHRDQGDDEQRTDTDVPALGRRSGSRSRQLPAKPGYSVGCGYA